ncbi:RHS repeat domain-containing protein [Bradyrhizobium sp. Ash2021]|uniref:RHS repeat domain-containing protein n=1 Tax=Bradyrhizobium sp. Ash2021 TaxID=2954771 RepID=UPI002815FBC7|nr:RHS repeat domain-containing protein [Bradyrhizobium sp. Ash2021]WMT72064.1 RHS repeat protein [Bradyrhizobium sp. Ash2021]
MIRLSSPDTGATVYTYDALGKPTKITDERGVVTNLTYDNVGRLLTSDTIAYTWEDTIGGNKGVGRVTQIQDASGSVEWIYNALRSTEYPKYSREILSISR